MPASTPSVSTATRGPFADGLIHLAASPEDMGTTLCGTTRGETPTLVPEKVISHEVAFHRECDLAGVRDHLQPCLDCKAAALKRAQEMNARGPRRIPSSRRR